jgi:hypothetical protein
MNNHGIKQLLILKESNNLHLLINQLNISLNLI